MQANKSDVHVLRFFQKISLVLFAFFTIAYSNAQVKTGFGHQSKCLQTSFSSYGIDSACETVAWFIGNSNTPISKQPYFSYTFTKAGTYTICMSVYNFCKRYDTMYCKSITVSDCNNCDSIETKLKINKDTTVCGKYYFDAYPKTSNTTKVTYAWTFGEGSKSDNDDPNITYSKNGTYQTCVTITAVKNGKTCVKTLCETLKVDCHSTQNKCNWKEKNIYINNQCNSWVFYAPYYDDSCMSYTWTINGKTYNDRYVTVSFEKKDSFEVCLKLKSSCTGCDTSMCTVIVNNCLPNTEKCEWSNVGIGHSVSKDICGKVIFEANAMRDSCIQTEYYFDGKWYSGRIFDHRFTQNGTYKYGFRYKNTCTGCDTTLYKWVEIGCFETKKCDWKNIGIGHSISKDICGKVIFEANYINDSCVITEYYFDGKWYSGRIFDHRFTQNGTYKYGFRYKNTCTGCDTTLYKWVEIGCFESKKCDWSRFNFEYRGYAGNDQNCLKYIFSSTNFEDSCITQKMKIVRENTVIYQETGRVHDYTFEKNGYYNVCFWANNECLKCDTWVCKTVYVNCENADISELKSLQIQPSPNPIQEELSLHNVSPLKVEIRNTLGQIVWQKNVEPEAKINLSHLTPQTYILTVSDSQGNYTTTKLIKN